MKSSLLAALVALGANEVAGHALFQQLWVDGVDQGTTCVRMPKGNTPVTNVGSRDVVCNANPSPASGKCAVRAGGMVTVEMHQQPGDRSCSNEAIGGAHWGPVQVYLTKVPDSATADGSTGWFKIFSDSWTKKPSGSVGDDDYWGTRDLNSCCGKMDVKVPADIPDGDYLLRAEAVALHTAGSSGGAQLYMSCYQITVAGGSGSSLPASLVRFPGAYKASDPGLLINIHAAVKSYIAPGPDVYAGGMLRTAGSSCSGCEQSCKVGGLAGGSKTTSAAGGTKTTPAGRKPPSVTTLPGTEADGNTEGCSVEAYGQCGGNGYGGCTACASGLVCKGVSAPYYSQCVAA